MTGFVHFCWQTLHTASAVWAAAAVASPHTASIKRQKRKLLLLPDGRHTLPRKTLSHGQVTLMSTLANSILALQAAAAVVRAYWAGMKSHRLELLLPQAGVMPAQGTDTWKSHVDAHISNFYCGFAGGRCIREGIQGRHQAP